MNFEEIKDRLLTRKHAWLITGVAGFIGSHLLEFLIAHDQKVIGIDNFFMGRQKNLQEALVTRERTRRVPAAELPTEEELQ